MRILPRFRLSWPGWLAWALPASIGLIVVGYQVFYQVALNFARSVGIFWGEVLIFGVFGPLVAWMLLRQLALDATDSRAAAERINALAAEERRRAQEVTALYAISAALNQALSEEDALKQALSRTLDVLNLESGRIYLFDAKSGTPMLAAVQTPRGPRMLARR